MVVSARPFCHPGQHTSDSHASHPFPSIPHPKSPSQINPKFPTLSGSLESPVHTLKRRRYPGLFLRAARHQRFIRPTFCFFSRSFLFFISGDFSSLPSRLQQSSSNPLDICPVPRIRSLIHLHLNFTSPRCLSISVSSYSLSVSPSATASKHA